MAIRALVFDFDGLVIDSETPLFDIWQEIYRRHGADLTLDSWRHALGTQGGFDPYADLAARTGHLLARDETAAHVRREHLARCGREPLLPGVADRLAEARAARLGVAIASSSPRWWVAPWIDQHGLAGSIDTICTRDDVRRVKPAPDLFLLAAERLGVVPGECVVFEDSPNGIRAARAAGMWAVAVPNTLTRALQFPDPHLVLASLGDQALDEILRRLDGLV